MLVIIGDLHLSDNSLSQTADASACRVLRNQISELAARASMRMDACYRPLDRIDIILLGDTLDIIQSDYWIKNQVRPWPDPYSRKTIDAVSMITDRILKANREFAQILRELWIAPTITQVSPDPSAANVTDRAAHLIPLHIHYMVGEHDWPLQLPGAGYDLVRQKVIHTLGLASKFDQPFPCMPQDSAELDQVLRTHQVYAHHGNRHDPLCRITEFAQPCLANVLWIELLQRFFVETIETAGNGLPSALLTRFRELFDCRPIQDTGRRLNSVLVESIRSPALLRKYRAIWNTSVSNALQIYQQQQTLPFGDSELVNQLAASLSIKTDAADEETDVIGTVDGFNPVSLREHALAEPILRTGRARHVVYGHSHQYEHFALQAQLTSEDSVEQTYFNCGTWRPVFPLQVNALKPHAVRPHQQISMLVFYKEDERSGHPYETWHATLAPSQRVAKPISNHKPEKSSRAVRSLVKASVMARPHFLAPADAKSSQVLR